MPPTAAERCCPQHERSAAKPCAESGADWLRVVASVPLTTSQGGSATHGDLAQEAAAEVSNAEAVMSPHQVVPARLTARTVHACSGSNATASFRTAWAIA